MTPEEFNRIKEAEKDHLRKIRKLKQASRQLERQKKITKAVTDMTSSLEETRNVHDEMVNRLSAQAAINEARLEMALEATEDVEQAQQEIADEETLARKKAQDLVRKLRAESVADAVSAGPITQLDKQSDKEKEDSKGHLPEKTIGRMKP